MPDGLHIEIHILLGWLSAVSFLHYSYGMAVLLVKSHVLIGYIMLFSFQGSKSRFLQYVIKKKKVIAFNRVDILCPERNSLIEDYFPQNSI